MNKVYLDHLFELVSMPSPFTDLESKRKVMAYCRSVFEENLPMYKIHQDAQENLIAVPEQIDPSKDIVYLSAHIDTVGADSSLWDAPYHPFQPYQDDQEIVARGVSDCKAGVAYQLYLTHLISEGKFSPSNLVFTLTFNEEGAVNKTSVEIGKAMGKTLPMSEADTYFIVLENNVRVQEPPVLCVYAQERSNYVIAVEGTMIELQEILQKLEKWNPVSIAPLNFDLEVSELKSQSGGHVCSVPREKNLLTEILLAAEAKTVVSAGNRNSFAVVPAEIEVGTSPEAVRHSLVLSNRSFDKVEAVEKQLEGIDYERLKPFAISEGFDLQEKVMANKVASVLDSAAENIELEFTFNVGASDATMICASLAPEFKERFYPLVMGPGSRSQRKREPQRLTHGKNETFDKKSGLAVVQFLDRVLERLV